MLDRPSTSVCELAVLRFLAYTSCATMRQLHLVCCPDDDPATVRTRLRNLRDARWITRTPWYLSHVGRTRGQIWTLTPWGSALVQQYEAAMTAPPMGELGRPRTALEFEAWTARLDVRSVLMYLICAARRHALLTHLQVTLPPVVSTLDPVTHGPTPDAELRINWEAPTQQANDWLPWPALHTTALQRDAYALYLDRASLGSVALTLARWLTTVPAGAAAVLVWRTDARLDEACQALHALPDPPALRMTSWHALEHGLDGDIWYTTAGARRSLRLDRQDLLGACHAVPAA